MADADLTEDLLLGGRVRLRQPRQGLRAGHDAVLLAAAVPAKSGDLVLEGGCGAGAGFLCLMARVPGLRVVAVEREPVLAALARQNAVLNGHGDAVTVLEGDIADPALRGSLPRIAHGFANPPYWPEGTRPPVPLRAAATHADGVALGDWAGFLAFGLAHLGSATLVLPAARFAEGLAALAASGCGSLALLPLWPRPGQAARLVLVAGRRGGRGPQRVLPGLALHDGRIGRGTEAAAALKEAPGAAAEAVLRDAAALML